MNFKKFKKLIFLLALFFLISYGFYTQAQQDQIDTNTDMGTVNAVLESGDNRITIGEFLPISIKLLNFGSEKRVDVTIYYRILNNNNEEVYSESETVAVETTASFIKRIRIPFTTKPGLYSIETSLNYPGQEQPAVSSFSFTVEEKFGGLFKNELISYLILVFVIIFVIIFSIYLYIKWDKKYRTIFHDYSDKPKEQVIYYEILSDIISQMRLRIGDDAFKIAKNIPDLEVNDINGRVIDIKGEPAKIVALLVDRYEKVSGGRVNFSLRHKK